MPGQSSLSDFAVSRRRLIHSGSAVGGAIAGSSVLFACSTDTESAEFHGGCELTAWDASNTSPRMRTSATEEHMGACAVSRASLRVEDHDV